MRKSVYAIVLLFLAFAALGSLAQTRERVKFARGTSSVKVYGTVRGFAYRDYVVRASAGQSIGLKLASPNTYSVFTIFLPNGGNLEGAAELDQFKGELPVSGDYVIRVGMVRAGARRRGSVSNFSLSVSIK